MAITETDTPTVPWEQFQDAFRWEQGEHVTLIGATGRGKTTLELAILPRRRYVIFLGTKKRDGTQNALTRKMGYMPVSDPDEIHPDVATRWVLRPDFPKGATVAQLKRAHSNVFRRALMMAFQQGNWTIVCDEVRYLTEYLRLADELELLWLQGRSLGVTLVAGTQRPRNVPLEAYSQARHIFLWHTPDGGDVSRIAEVAGVNPLTVRDIVPNLKGHSFLYVHPETGQLLISQSPPPN